MKYSVLEHKDYVYFIQKQEYYCFDKSLNKVDKDSVSTEEGWRSVWPDFTACYSVGDMAYFFKGEEFMTYDLSKNEPGPKKRIRNEWNVLIEDPVGVIDDTEFVYFFKKDRYICYDKENKRACAEHVIKDVWPGIWEGGIESVGKISEKVWFFRGTKCIAYNLKDKKVEGKVNKIHEKWNGVPPIFKHGEEFYHHCDCCEEGCYGKYSDNIGVPCWDRPICCKGNRKKYICCNKEYGIGHESKAHSKHNGTLEGECVGACSCSWDCNGGDPEAPKCRDRPICCRGWPKHYNCCRRHYGMPGCVSKESYSPANLPDDLITYVISDVHLTYDCGSKCKEKVNDYVVKKSKKKPKNIFSNIWLSLRKIPKYIRSLFKKPEKVEEPCYDKRTVVDQMVDFLDYLLKSADKEELVLLGDIFDVWYTPIHKPITPVDGDDYLQGLLDRNEDIRRVISKLNEFIRDGGTLVYVLGNHDHLLTEKVLKKHIPGINFYHDFYVNYNACFTHGNLFDMFNRSFNKYPVPLGLYITQCACEYGGKEPKSIFKKLLQSSIARPIHNLTEFSFVANAYYDQAFYHACNKTAYYQDREVTFGMNKSSTISEIMEKYEDLPKEVDTHYSKYGIENGVALSIQGSIGAMDVWANWCMKLYNVDYVFMGHTHEDRILSIYDKKQDCKDRVKKYVNSGQFPTVLVIEKNNGKVKSTNLYEFKDKSLSLKNINNGCIASATDTELCSFNDLDTTSVTHDNKHYILDSLMLKKLQEGIWRKVPKDRTLRIIVNCPKDRTYAYCYLAHDKPNQGNKVKIVCEKCEEVIIPFSEFIPNPMKAEEVAMDEKEIAIKSEEVAILRLLEKAIVYPELQAYVQKCDAAPVNSESAKTEEDKFAELKRMKRTMNLIQKNKDHDEGALLTLGELKNANYYEIDYIRLYIKKNIKVIIVFIQAIRNLTKYQ
eukprot:TRINITY_DN6410_c0_g1_i1.p1 TRINITY_DN6410_c0_g1~~TRINITY_DN6410_c0_g1_i1.p1  ORF type:complete len:942 (-),score=106.41 TRINITY_DN6410_c0_g1_i1:582-3407(-)